MENRVSLWPMRQIRASVRLVALFIAFAAVFSRAPLTAQAPPSTLRHLQGIDDLKSWFNAGNGHPRLIFLLSPT